MKVNGNEVCLTVEKKLTTANLDGNKIIHNKSEYQESILLTSTTSSVTIPTKAITQCAATPSTSAQHMKKRQHSEISKSSLKLHMNCQPFATFDLLATPRPSKISRPTTIYWPPVTSRPSTISRPSAISHPSAASRSLATSRSPPISHPSTASRQSTIPRPSTTSRTLKKTNQPSTTARLSVEKRPSLSVLQNATGLHWVVSNHDNPVKNG